MVSLRSVFLWIALFLLALQSSALGQEQSQRKVYNNEDVEDLAPARPAPQTSEAEKTPAATTPATEQPSAQQPAPAEQPAGLEGEMKKFQELLAIFKQSLDEFLEKEEQATDPTLKERWHDMTGCLVSLIQATQRTVNELDEQIKQQQEQQSNQSSL